MDLIKKLTGKNPTEYEMVAKSLVDNSNTELFCNLVKQDDFLFDFIKDNVAKRIQNACNKDNYLNLLKFFDFYSPSYDTMIARVLYSFSGDNLLPEMKEFFVNGTESQKAYAVKYFSFVNPEKLQELIPLLRITSWSNYEPLALNSIEVLSILNDKISKVLVCFTPPANSLERYYLPSLSNLKRIYIQLCHYYSFVIYICQYFMPAFFTKLKVGLDCFFLCPKPCHMPQKMFQYCG